MTFAVAKLPLIRIFNGESKVFKGDRQSIGYKQSKRSDIDFNFTNHKFPLQKGMSFYLITDGFTDQLGGNQKRKICFGNKRLLKLLKELADQPLAKQGKILLQALAKHQGGEERQDDVTLIGFKISEAETHNFQWDFRLLYTYRLSAEVYRKLCISSIHR